MQKQAEDCAKQFGHSWLSAGAVPKGGKSADLEELGSEEAGKEDELSAAMVWGARLGRAAAGGGGGAGPA